MAGDQYDAEDEYAVAQGIFDALSLRDLKKQTGIEWLGWTFEEPSCGEIEIKVGQKKFRIIVEPWEEPSCEEIEIKGWSKEVSYYS